MTDWNAIPEHEFRRHLGEFVDRNLSREMRFMNRRPSWKENKPWYLALSRAGLVAPGWPVAHGGMGLGADRHLVYIEEMERCGVPWLHDSGVRNLGPVLIAHGTEEQKREYLPRMLSGDHMWCQGYSEPGAGSDLASLRTEARLDGDELVINGSKIWTTVAHEATHMFALVRTGKGARKQEGISFVLLEMDQPGITVRTIPNLGGHEEFCEVFLKDVRTHCRNVVGALDDGWRVAKAQLGFERIWAGSPRRAMKALWRLEAVANANGLAADPVFHDRLVRMRFDVEDLNAMYERFADMLRDKGQLGVEVSALKIWATDTFKRVTEMLIEAAGDLGALRGEVDFGAPESIDVLSPFWEARAPTIFAGTNEVHRNILARSVLALGGGSASQTPGTPAERDETRAMLRESARDFVASTRDFGTLRAMRGTGSGFAPDLSATMAGLGWFGALLPEDLGGSGLALGDLAAVAEELGRGLLGEPLVAGSVPGARALLHSDAEALKKRLLPRVAEGSLSIALAFQEARGAWCPQECASAVTVEGDGEAVRLSGDKHLVAGAAAAGGFLVWAGRESGEGLYWVEREAAGLAVDCDWRADGTPLGRLALQQTPAVRAGSRGAARSALERAIDESALIASAELLGVTRAALDTTLEYLRTRVQFGQAIGNLQALQHRAVDLYMQQELARSALIEALGRLDRAPQMEPRELRRLAARVKARCSEAALTVAREGVQLHGAMGITDECDIGLYLKRAIVLSAWLGNADRQRRRWLAAGA